MPTLPEFSLLSIVARGVNSTSQNATTLGSQNVVCAWPVSGQYGPGSRSLYYALVVVCVFARKAAWLRKACLAAALLFPAVAAIHGIVLAATHVNGAADMDVYGSFQFCAIGILAAPVTVRLSGTYLKDPGRNIIYLWTFLLLAGLLSLMVEFIRIDPIPCTLDDSGNPIPPGQFPYGNVTCGLPCYVGAGPNGEGFSSPLRQGSANNIYIIPEPDRLTFNTATLMAAGCCLPAVLSLISMWNKILEINWKTRNKEEVERLEDEFITGTNGATIKEMKSLNGYLRKFLSAVEVPVFGAAVLAILVLGEENFFSPQVAYQTEPIASVGQWAPIAGTGLALIGSLYILLMHMQDPEEVKEEEKPASFTHHCNCSGHGEGRTRHSSDSSISAAIISASPNNLTPNTTRGEDESEAHHNAGYRARVAETLASVGEWFGTAADDRFDDSNFRRGRADDYPEIPGEKQRNRKLPEYQIKYNKPRDADGNVTPRAGSPHSQMSRRRAMTLQPQRSMSDMRGEPSDLSPRKRGLTLEVPAKVHYGLSRSESHASPLASLSHVPLGQNSPTIIISDNVDGSSVEHKEYAEDPETLGKGG